MGLLVIGTVYKTIDSVGINAAGVLNTQLPSFEVDAGTVDVFTSNLKDKPANTTTMQLDTASPIADGTITQVQGGTKWIAFETDTGSPVVNEHRLVSLKA